MSDSSDDSGARKARSAMTVLLVPLLWGACGLLGAGLLAVGVYLWNQEHADTTANAQHIENLKQDVEGQKTEIKLIEDHLDRFNDSLKRTNRVLEKLAEKQGVYVPP